MFAVGYADLDNFKPFNDHYGFTRGDEVIKMTRKAHPERRQEQAAAGSFVGHIGGDDFIFIMDADLIDATAAEMVATFDRIISTFYDAADKEAGGIVAIDRQGNPRSFSLDVPLDRDHQQQKPSVLSLRRGHRGRLGDEAVYAKRTTGKLLTGPIKRRILHDGE